MFNYQYSLPPGANHVAALIVVGLIVGSLVLFVLGLAGGYYFDNIRTPPGNEHSVPMPKTY